MECPPAWALTHIEEKLFIGKFDWDTTDLMAMGFIELLRHVVGRWKHHAIFPVIARSLCSEFHHAVATLVIASYLSDHGNPIGITDTPAQPGRSPDLFLNLDANQKLPIEVKASPDFYWPSALQSTADIERRVLKQINEAKGQLIGDQGGLVVLGAFHPDPTFFDLFKVAVENVVVRGRPLSKKVVGVSVVCFSAPSLSANLTRGEIRGQLNLAAKIEVVKNPQYTGSFKIETAPRT